MEINKNNYEEYFLLYADNELTKEQRRLVEAFVTFNPEYQQEFDAILSTVQSPDNAALADKTFLMKTRMDDFINGNNFEEKFIQYHDSELNDEEKILVEQFLRNNEKYYTEFDLLTKARLTPDLDIRYPGINKLYKKSARVVLLKSFKYPVAAALAGLILWFGATKIVVRSSDDGKGIASAASESRQYDNNGTEIIEHPNTRSTGERDIAQSDTRVAAEATAKNGKAADVKQLIFKGSLPVRSITPQIKSTGLTDVSVEPGIPEINRIPEEAGSINTNIVISEKNDIQQLATSLTQPAMNKTKLTADRTSPDLNNLFSDDKTDDYVLYDFPAENLRKSKIGIFVKKVTRTINRGNPVNRWLNGENTEQ